MRLRLKKTLQILAACACVLIYINFFLASKSIIGGFGFPSSSSNSLRKYEQTTATADNNVTLTYVTNSPGQVTQARQLAKLGPQVYPNLLDYSDDRIVSQLSYVPRVLSEQLKTKSGDVKLKKIMLFNGIGGWDLKHGQQTFLDQKCRVPYCEVTDNKDDLSSADVVFFQGVPRSNLPKSPHQKWLLFLLESPYHTPGLEGALGLINWTATYRHDSTIVAPYEKFVPFNTSVLTKPQEKNYAAGKTKKVAWFVSNCGARNGRRQYADELAKYIQVDIYGNCGTLQCPRYESNKCFDMLNTDYKFYLSFENSNCRDYITEKFFVNGLKHDVIPIVMGAAPEDYKRASPPHSFIHVDHFESPKHLADYLILLDKDDKLYNEYFQWKGTGDIINTFFWCRVCALAHDVDRGQSWYNDVESWWRGPGVCIGQENWRNRSRDLLIADMPIVIPPNKII
ncbi:unnamed protein product [Lymnaea stagnalis]|uniref:Fucosyltransferase n=1 Tax=Lymnaea stagnalis TaxID=6523 RepID=A0AAV2HIJ5_LYMST